MVLAGALLASCGSEPAPPSVQVGGVSGTELHPAQVLRKGNGAEPQTLDPHKAEGVPSSNILRDLYEGLVSQAPDGALIPAAAETWEVSPDGLVYMFKLRDDMSWSNGDILTAEDFAYGFQRSVDPATLSRYSSILYPIQNAEEVVTGKLQPEELGVRALDKFHLEIRLNAPTPYFLGLLTHSTTYPVHRQSVEAYGDQFSRPGRLVSNGAYQLDDWVIQSHVKLKRNPRYWDNQRTSIDEVWYYATENLDTELKRYRAGELDMTYTLPLKQLGWIRENLAAELSIEPYLGSYYFGFNLTRPPFKDRPKLRQALSMAIDREILTGKVTGAGEIPAYGWVPPVAGYEGQRPEWAEWTQEQRNEEAQRLYRESGYGPDNPLELEIMYNTQQDHKRMSAAVAAMWKQTLGVNVSLINQEWKVFLETRQRKVDTQVYRSGWIGDYNDAYSFAQLLHSKNGQNDMGYENPRYDALIDAAAVETDLSVRAQIMQDAEQILLGDTPLIPIYFYVTKRVIKPWVDGFEPNIMDHHYTKNFRILKH